MRNQRKNKMIFIGVLALAVGGITIGFAAFSNVLTIRSSATVNPDPSTFNVSLSSSATSVEKNEVVPTSNNATVAANSSNAVISNDGKILSNISFAFTEPGQSVTYSLFAYNDGEYEAHYKSFTHQRPSSTTESKTAFCIAGEGTTEALAKEACKAIKVDVSVDGCVHNSNTISSAWTTSFTCGRDITLLKRQSHPITITFTYKEDGARADGPISIEYGDMELKYGSAPNN